MRIRPQAPDVRHTHLSAHDGHNTPVLLDAVADYARHSDIITLTGVGQGDTVGSLQEFRDMWFYQGETDIAPCDSAVGWGPKWDLVQGTTPLIYTGDRCLCATSVVLRHYLTAQQIMVSVSRLPDHIVERRTLGKVGFYQRTLLAWKRHVLHTAREHAVDGIMVVADWNLDIEKPWVHAWVRLAWPELHNTRRPNPVYKVNGRVLGTEGSRATDWTLSDLSVIIPAHVRHDVPEFAHRPYHESLAFPA